MITAIRDSRNSGVATAAGIGAAIGGLCLISPAVAGVTIGGAAFTLLVLRFPIILCYLMVAAVTLLSGITRGKFVPMLRLNEVLLVVSVAFMMIFLIVDRSRSVNLRKVGGVFGPFLLLVLGTIIIPIMYFYGTDRPATIDGLMDMISPVKFFLLFLVFTVIPRSSAEWRPLLVWMAVCGAIVSLIGLLQAANISAIHQLIGTWYASEHTATSLEGEGGRVTSLMGAWNALGMLLMITLGIAWAGLQVPDMRRYRAVLSISAILAFLCLIASGSFAGIFGLVMTILLIEVLTNRITTTVKKLALGASIAGIGLALAFPLIETVVLGRIAYQFGGASDSVLPQTFVYRFWIWNDVFWPYIVKNPIFGTSLDIPQDFRWLFAESHYISLLFRFGAIGLFAHILWTVLTLAWLAGIVRKPDPLTRKMAAASFAALVVLTISSFTNEVFLFTGSIDYLWILIALAANQGEVSES